MAHNDSKRTASSKRNTLSRRMARTCKHHMPNALSRSGRERIAR